MPLFRVNAIAALCTTLCLIAPVSSTFAQMTFFDDFEDRVQDQPLLGNDWTWYDMTFGGDTCEGDTIAEFGPFSDGDGSDFGAENRNYYTASADVGEGDSYYRAGLEVPAWEGGLSNMLRVYGNQFNTAMSCQRTLIFQQMDITEAGTHVFSFDVAQDQFGAPANGETLFAFVKILKSSDSSFEELVFERIEIEPLEATSPLDVETLAQRIEFLITEEHVGELLQFGFFNDLTPSLGHSWTTSGAYYDNIELSKLVIGPGHSGSFFNLGQDGHGFSVEFGTLPDGTPLAVIYWYTYDSDGNNVFLIGNGVPNGNTVEVTFQSALGMRYGDWNPDDVSRETAGVGVFTFIDRENAMFSYTPSAFSMSTFGHTTPVEDLPILRVFAIPAKDSFE